MGPSVRSLCDIYFSTARVEDRFGRGNGLDAWRLNDTETGLEGWQFRRLENRFEDSQVADLKNNIRVAAAQSIKAFSLPLVKFTAVLNIDPQPPHSGAAGEDERLHRVKVWAKDSYGVEFEFYGLNWVRTRLLLNPGLRPDLFEDIQAAIAEAKNQIFADMRGNFSDQAQAIGNQFDSLLRIIDENARLKEDVQKKVRKLTEEARRHFERGGKLQSHDEFTRAATSLDDALRLIEDEDEKHLKASILSLLAGVETVGRLQLAIRHERAALALCDPSGDQELYFQSLGNLGFALGCNQEFDEAESILRQVLRAYEEKTNLGAIVNTLMHLTELCVNAKNPKGAMHWCDRLRTACPALVAITGMNEMSLSAMGASAAQYCSCGRSTGTVRRWKMPPAATPSLHESRASQQ